MKEPDDSLSYTEVLVLRALQHPARPNSIALIHFYVLSWTPCVLAEITRAVWQLVSRGLVKVESGKVSLVVQNPIDCPPIKTTRGYAAVGLYEPKTSQNVGGVVRAAYCYGAAFVAQSGIRYEGSALDTAKGHRHLPLLTVDNLISTVPYGCVAVAVDLLPNARSLVDYTHPERAFYVFGPEDGTLPAEIVSHCRDVVHVPTRYCMNLAATVNVVLYDRLAKRS